MAREQDTESRGSWQNPVWRRREGIYANNWPGYNSGKPSIHFFDFRTQAWSRVTDGVITPGAGWNARNNRILFSSDSGTHDAGDQIWSASADGADRQRHTFRDGWQYVESAWGPGGANFVAEGHRGDSPKGVVTLFHDLQGKNFTDLTDPRDDCREPNFSADGRYICYQKKTGGEGQWNIWAMELKPGADGRLRPPWQVTKEGGTDPSFAPDNQIVYSNERDEGKVHSVALNGSNDRALVNRPGYQGAVSMSADGKYVAFETSSGGGRQNTLIDIAEVKQPFAPAPQIAPAAGGEGQDAASAYKQFLAQARGGPQPTG